MGFEVFDFVFGMVSVVQGVWESIQDNSLQRVFFCFKFNTSCLSYISDTILLANLPKGMLIVYVCP